MFFIISNLNLSDHNVGAQEIKTIFTELADEMCFLDYFSLIFQ